MPRVHSSVLRRRRAARAARLAAAEGGETANANMNVHNIADNVAGRKSVAGNEGGVDNADYNARSSSTNLDASKAAIQALVASQLQIVRSIQRLVEVLERQWMFSELYKERDGFMKMREDVHKKIEDLDHQVMLIRDLLISLESEELNSAEFVDHY